MIYLVSTINSKMHCCQLDFTICKLSSEVAMSSRVYKYLLEVLTQHSTDPIKHSSSLLLYHHQNTGWINGQFYRNNPLAKFSLNLRSHREILFTEDPHSRCTVYSLHIISASIHSPVRINFNQSINQYSFIHKQNDISHLVYSCVY